MLSDSERMKKTKKRPLRKLKSESYWGDQQKMEAVETFIMLGGNLHQVALALGIPRPTLIRWKKTEWWKELYDEVKQQDNLVLSIRLQKIVSRSLDLVEDRLEKGDVFYDQKLGQVVRKEVGIRDAHQIFKDSFLVKEQIEKPAPVQMDGESVSDKLAALALQFERLADAQKTKPKIEVTDVVFVEQDKENDHSIHEKREEGLQA